jgi:SAM-dependent methyltransferase
MFCVCCQSNVATVGEVNEREGGHCPNCGSTGRDRYMTLAVLGAVTALASEPTERELSVVGVSDSHVVEAALGTILGDCYRNYQFHTEPFLDLVELRPDQLGMADVITCSDVLEHVPNPVARAFTGMFDLLTAGGIAVVSVPHFQTGSGEHDEHFPALDEARIEDVDGELTYIGLDQDGIERRFTGLVFHGGDGRVLEYRTFSPASLYEHFADAGFTDARPLRRNLRQFGAGWEDWSRVWVARKPTA